MRPDLDEKKLLSGECFQSRECMRCTRDTALLDLRPVTRPKIPLTRVGSLSFPKLTADHAYSVLLPFKKNWWIRLLAFRHPFAFTGLLL